MVAPSGYHGSLAQLAAVYAHGIAMNHPFVDGNKRADLIALFVAAMGKDVSIEG